MYSVCCTPPAVNVMMVLFGALALGLAGCGGGEGGLVSSTYSGEFTLVWRSGNVVLTDQFPNESSCLEAMKRRNYPGSYCTPTTSNP